MQLPRTTAGVVGYGVAGRLYGDLLAQLQIDFVIVEPDKSRPTDGRQVIGESVESLKAVDVSAIDVWVICCPTSVHFTTARDILSRNPAARILIEKPACEGHEISALDSLLASHPHARVVISDHYQHSTAIGALVDAMHGSTSLAPERITVAFTKDRTSDVGRGRFIDRSYGVLGYEWLHMLTVLSRILPHLSFIDYLESEADLYPSFDPTLFLAALTEHSRVRIRGSHETQIELFSSVLQTHDIAVPPPTKYSDWYRDDAWPNNRHRSVMISSGRFEFILQLEPVPSQSGWVLGRNRHRITALRDSVVFHDEIIEESPFYAAGRVALSQLMSTAALPKIDFRPLYRIASLSLKLRGAAPGPLQTAIE